MVLLSQPPYGPPFQGGRWGGMSLRFSPGCFAKLPLAQHPERSEGPTPLQWLELAGDRVAHIAIDGAPMADSVRRSRAGKAEIDVTFHQFLRSAARVPRRITRPARDWAPPSRCMDKSLDANHSHVPTVTLAARVRRRPTNDLLDRTPKRRGTRVNGRQIVKAEYRMMPLDHRSRSAVGGYRRDERRV